MPTIGERFRRSWNAFIGRDPTKMSEIEYGWGSGYRPDKVRLSRTNAQSIVGFIYNRIAIDVASIDIRHVRINEVEKFKDVIRGPFDDRLTLEANIDQSARSFKQDLVMSMFDEGVVAVVPVDCITNEDRTRVAQGQIFELRTGKIVSWYPDAVKVNIYNQRTGRREDIVVPKTLTAIIENPFYSIMNEPNSTLQRLLRTINDLNSYNDNAAAGKLDLIIQLPYVIKSELRRKEAMKRRQEIEDQLTGSKYGVAYTDGTERVIQLNRSLENNLWTQVKDLTDQLYSQLGITASIFDGTADEATMINYHNKSVEPIIGEIALEYKRKFLTQTAITQGQSVMYFRNPFKLVPVSQLADIADKFTRNEIMSSNEVRSEIGYRPVDNMRADELRNKNINTSNLEMETTDVFGNTRTEEVKDEKQSETTEAINDLGG